MVDLHMHWPVVPYVDFSFDFLVHPPGLFWSIDPPGYLLEGGESCLTRGKMEGYPAKMGAKRKESH